MQIRALLLDNSTGPWHLMYQKGVLKTWCKPSNNGLITNMYLGKKPKNRVINDAVNKILVSRYIQKYWRFFQVKAHSTQIDFTEVDGIIELDIPEVWPNITLKSLAAIRYVHNHHNYDFLIRANASCYVNLPALRTHLKSLNSKFIYAGPKATSKNFISGWAIVFNRKTIEILLNGERTNFLELFDDEAIGQMLKASGIAPLPIPYLEIFSLEELNTKTKEELAVFPLIRLKAANNGKRIDDVLMCRIHEILGE
jgi:hypothetical protein